MNARTRGTNRWDSRRRPAARTASKCGVLVIRCARHRPTPEGSGISAQPDERQRYDAADLRAYEDHDRESPLWRSRGMAWAIARAMCVPLPDAKSALRTKVRAECDVLEQHLREYRNLMTTTVAREIETALGELNAALCALNAVKPRLRR